MWKRAACSCIVLIALVNVSGAAPAFSATAAQVFNSLADTFNKFELIPNCVLDLVISITNDLIASNDNRAVPKATIESLTLSNSPPVCLAPRWIL